MNYTIRQTDAYLREIDNSRRLVLQVLYMTRLQACTSKQKVESAGGYNI
jgi:hypothetical protein